MRKMELKNMDSMAILNSLFNGQQGAFPKLFYLGPILLWLVGGFVFLSLPHSFGAAATGNSANNLANNLQEDINLISQKAEKAPLLDMTKKAMIQEDKKKSFLGQKARQQIDKSVVAKSAGQFDKQIMVFDSALNRMVYAPLPQDMAIKAADEEEDINTVLGQIEINRPNAYQQNERTNSSNQFTDKTGFAATEAERLKRFAAAKAENKQRRAVLDKTQTQIQAEAYERAIQDNEKRYRHVYGLDENGQPMAAKKTSPSKTQHLSAGEKRQVNHLTFSTAIGTKDNLQLSKETSTTTKNNAPPKNIENSQTELARLAPTNQVPLLAVIDQAQKIKSGDKVQLRIIEEGLYQGLFIPQNTIFYGLCTVNNDRINIRIPSIQLDAEVYPSNLSVFDPDGLEGIYVDGTFNDWTKQAVQEGLSAGNSLGVRNAFGNFSLKLGRKANNRIRVYVPGGYQVFLYEQ